MKNVKTGNISSSASLKSFFDREVQINQVNCKITLSKYFSISTVRKELKTNHLSSR